jgi:hypothetical protein
VCLYKDLTRDQSFRIFDSERLEPERRLLRARGGWYVGWFPLYDTSWQPDGLLRFVVDDVCDRYGGDDLQ